MKCERDLSLIVTIVSRGWGDTVLCASREAGAEGGSIMIGRGCGIHDKKSILGIMIEPEKELVIILTPEDTMQDIVQSIREKLDLDRPGNGIMFTQNIESAYGILD